MGGVFKGFQIACNLAGPLGDLTGRGDQPSGRVVHKNRTGPLGNLTGRGDQPSGKVVLVSGAVQVKGTTSTGSLQQEEDARGCSQFFWDKREKAWDSKKKWSDGTKGS